MNLHQGASLHGNVAGEESEFEEILYHITHDLRASLRAIKMIPDWIIEDVDASNLRLPDATAESLDMLKNQAVRMDKMLIDLRTYSRVGRKHDRPSTVSLLRILQSLVQKIDTTAGIVVDQDFQVPEIVAPANEIELLFDAFLDNAIKHHPLNSPKVTFSSALTDDWVEIAIEDNGAGVDPKFSERIFQMLTTLQPRDEVEGSGLGLAIARKICRSLGGDVEIQAAPSGSGAIFKVQLPKTVLPKSQSGPVRLGQI